LRFAIRNYALLFLGCLVFHAAGSWIVPLIDRDEPRFSEASREMIERSDYVVPFFNDEYRFDKPPFTYWAQIASYHSFGENDFAARFPSAVAASLVALVLFVWGTRVTDKRVGFWAAVIFTSSFQVVEHAKAAVADMWLVLFVTLAHWAGYELLVGAERPTSNVQRPTSNPEWWWIFYASLALAFLAKGPIGWTPLLTVWITVLFTRGHDTGRTFKFGRGMILTLALVCAWGMPALIVTHGQFFSIGIGRHVLERSISPLGGHGAKSFGMYLLLLPFYFVTVFLSFFPWSLKLPWLVRQVRTARDHIDVYLVSGIAVVFVVFSLVTTKLLHYTLPAFPLLALLLVRRWQTAGCSTVFFQRTAIAFATACLALILFLGPFVAHFFPSRALFRASQAYLKPEMKFAAVDFKEPSLVWYFRSRVRGFMRTWDMNADSAHAFLEEPGPRFVVMPTDMAQQILPALPPGWKDFRARGFNVVKGRRSDLTLILKPE
jgi:4-amino-4-deoxy-L-arabinose transferase-like glycosyltransferase